MERKQELKTKVIAAIMGPKLEMSMFGCTLADLIATNRDAQGDNLDKLMLAMSILSDAQEEIAHGHQETCRQFINRAKYFIDEVRTNLKGG